MGAWSGRVFVAAALAAGVYALIQLRFLQSFLDYDQLVYLLNMRGSYREPFFNPHHLHFETGGVYFYEILLRVFGADGPGDFAFYQRLRGVLFAAFGVGASVLFLYRITARLALALAGSAAMAFAHGYLHYAAKIDTPIYPAAWTPLLLLLGGELIWTARRGYGLALLFGAASAIGAMLHQYMGFLTAAVLFALQFPARCFRLRSAFLEFRPGFAAVETRADLINPLARDAAVRLRCALIAGGTALLLTAAAYYPIGVWYYNLPLDRPNVAQVRGTTWNGNTFQRWIFAYLNPESPFFLATRKSDPRETLRGFTDAALSLMRPLPKYHRSLKFEYDLQDWKNPARFAFHALAAGALGVFLGCVLLWDRLFARYGPMWLALLLAWAGFALVGVKVEPFYFEFWIIPFTLSVYIGVLLWNYLIEALESAAPLRAGWLAATPAACFAALLFTHNFEHYLRPHAETIYTEGLEKRTPGQVRYFTSPGLYRAPRAERIRAFGPIEEAPAPAESAP
jgi:hypothetical protein